MKTTTSLNPAKKPENTNFFPTQREYGPCYTSKIGTTLKKWQNLSTTHIASDPKPISQQLTDGFRQKLNPSFNKGHL